MNLQEKIKEYLEKKSGRKYRILGPNPGYYLWKVFKERGTPVPHELLSMDNVRMLLDNKTIEVGYKYFQTELFGVLEADYQIYMYLNEVMKSRDPNARKAARRLAPGPVMDCEFAEKAAKKASLKHFGDENTIIVDFHNIGMTVRFQIENLSDEEVLQKLERSINALSEAWSEYLKWYHSEERKKVYEKGVIERELPYLRHFIAEWPPNTGDPEKDREIIENVRQMLSERHMPKGYYRDIPLHKVYTPKGMLELKNGEIVVKEKRRKKILK